MAEKNSMNNMSDTHYVAERSKLIESSLREVLSNGCAGLSLSYQPQLNIDTGQLIGAEALLRWELNGETIAPVEFIPIAEASGLIVPIGEWVLREACQTAKYWQVSQIGTTELRVGVNVSVKQLSPSFPLLVTEILDTLNLKPDLLDIEITESLAMAGKKYSSVLQALVDMGIHLSMDDFGTGYSCLANLKHLPFNTLKIDRCFVQDLDKGCHSSRSLVEVIIRLAKNHGMQTIAEGVETKQQEQILHSNGCTLFQGFFYSKPLSRTEFEKYANSFCIQQYA